MLTNVINRPTSESQGCAIYIGPTRVDFSMLATDGVGTQRIGPATAPAAPTLQRQAQDYHPPITSPQRGQDVPRGHEITGGLDGEQLRFDREWKRTRTAFQNDTARYGFGTDAAKRAWMQRIRQTRTA